MFKRVPVQDFSGYLWAAIVIMLTSTLILMSLVVSYDIFVRLGLSSIPVALLLVGVTILWGPMILLIASLFVDVFAPFCFLPFGWGHSQGHHDEQRQYTASVARMDPRPDRGQSGAAED